MYIYISYQAKSSWPSIIESCAEDSLQLNRIITVHITFKILEKSLLRSWHVTIDPWIRGFVGSFPEKSGPKTWTKNRFSTVNHHFFWVNQPTLRIMDDPPIARLLRGQLHCTSTSEEFTSPTGPILPKIWSKENRTLQKPYVWHHHIQPLSHGGNSKVGALRSL